MARAPSPPSSSSPSPSSRSRLLLGLLAGMALLYLALQPALRRMHAETERVNRETSANQAEAARLGSLRADLEQARQRVRQAPDDIQARRELARRSEEAGEYEEALQQAEAVTRLLPRDAEAWVQTASLRQRLKRYDTAMEAYQQALAVAAGQANAVTGLAYLYVQMGWTLQAEEVLQAALRREPENLHLKVALALAYMQNADSAHAEQLLLEVKRAAPREPALWTPLVDVYMKEKRYAPALDAAQEALLLTPDNKPLLLLQGEAYYYLRDLPHAVQTLQRLLTLEPEHSVAHYYLGLCANSSGDLNAAARQMEASLQRDPGAASTQRALGQMYMRLHRETEGRRLIAAADRGAEEGQKRARLSYRLANHPESADAHRQMAQTYQEQNDLPHAIVEWKQVLRVLPADFPARDALRRALQSVGRGAEAGGS